MIQENVAVSDTAPCAVCYDAENGHYFRYVSASAITWNEAEARAAASRLGGLQGYLATITSLDEFTFINDVVFSRANFPTGMPVNVYVGGTDRSIPGEWKWVTGPESATTDTAGLVFYSNDTAQNGLIVPWDPHDSQSQINGSTGEYYLYLSSWSEPGFAVNTGAAIHGVTAGGNSGYLVEYSR